VSTFVSSDRVLSLAALNKNNPFVVRSALSQFAKTVKRTTAHREFLCTVLEPSLLALPPTNLVASLLLAAEDLKHDVASDLCVVWALAKTVLLGLRNPALRPTALRACFECRDCPLALSLVVAAGGRDLVAGFLRSPEPEDRPELDDWRDIQGLALDVLRVLREPPAWVFDFCAEALKRRYGPLDRCRVWMLAFMLRTGQGRPLTRAELVCVANNRGWRQKWRDFLLHEDVQRVLPSTLADLVAAYCDEEPAPEASELDQLAMIIAASLGRARGVFENLARFGPLGSAYQALLDGSRPDQQLLDGLPAHLAVEVVPKFLELLSPLEQAGLLHQTALCNAPVTAKTLVCRAGFYRSAAGWLRFKTCSDDTVLGWLRQIEQDLAVSAEVYHVLAPLAQDLVVELLAGVWLVSPELLDVSDRLRDCLPVCAELSSCRGLLADLLWSCSSNCAETETETEPSSCQMRSKIRAQAYTVLHEFEQAVRELHSLGEVHHSVHAQLGAVFQAWAAREPIGPARARLLAQADECYSVALQTEHRRDWILARAACSSASRSALDYLWLRYLNLHMDRDKDKRAADEHQDQDQDQDIWNAADVFPIGDSEAQLDAFLKLANMRNVQELLRHADTDEAVHMMYMLAVLTPAAMTAVDALDEGEPAERCRRLTRMQPTCVGAWLAHLDTDRTFERAEEVLAGLAEARVFSRVDIVPPRRPAVVCFCLWIQCRELLRDMGLAPEERFRKFRHELARIAFALVGATVDFPDPPEEKQQVSVSLPDLAPCWFAYVEACVETLGIRLVLGVRRRCLDKLGSELAQPSHPVVWCAVLLLMAMKCLVQRPSESGYFFDLSASSAEDLSAPSIHDWLRDN
jgi:hypothetical protein